MALFEAAENLKTDMQNNDSQIEFNDSNLLDDNDLKDFEQKFNNQKYDDLFGRGLVLSP